MRLSIFPAILLGPMALGIPASAAETEFPHAAGTDSIGRAQAVSDAAGRVLIESPEFPRGLWVELMDDAGQALAGIQVEYEGRPDSLVAIWSADPSGERQETLLWTRLGGDTLRLALRAAARADLPPGLAGIDWRIDPGVDRLHESHRLVGWEALAALLRQWSSRGGMMAVMLDNSSISVDLERAEAMETLVTHLRRMDHLAETPTFRAAVYQRGNSLPPSGVVLQVEWFEDVNLQAAVRKALFLPDGRMTRQKIASLKSLRAHERNIHSLAGAGQLTGLEWLGLFGNRIVNVGPLASLARLETLGLNFNEVVDVSPLAALTNLEALYVQGNEIVDVSALAALARLKTLALGKGQMADVSSVGLLTSLEVLWLDDNVIVDVSPLAALASLSLLDLSYNRIVDVSALATLTGLKVLNLGSNEIVDVSPLSALTRLQSLYLGSNEIVDLEPLTALTGLSKLELNNNQIEDISPLIANTGLGRWDSLFLEGNPLSDEAINQQIPALRARGVTVGY